MTADEVIRNMIGSQALQIARLSALNAALKVELEALRSELAQAKQTLEGLKHGDTHRDG